MKCQPVEYTISTLNIKSKFLIGQFSDKCKTVVGLNPHAITTYITIQDKPGGVPRRNFILQMLFSFSRIESPRGRKPTMVYLSYWSTRELNSGPFV